MHVNVSICESQLRYDDTTNVLNLQGAAGTPGLDVSLLNFVCSVFCEGRETKTPPALVT